VAASEFEKVRYICELGSFGHGCIHLPTVPLSKCQPAFQCWYFKESMLWISRI